MPDATVAASPLAGFTRADLTTADDVLASFDRPGTSNGPTEAINGRLEHLRGSALGFRNLTNYIARSRQESGGFRPRLHTLDREEPVWKPPSGVKRFGVRDN